MNDFIEHFINSMMSEAGLVACMLLIGLVYQTKQLTNERSETKKLNGQILNLATGQVKAMNELQSVLKSVMQFLPSLGGK